VSILEADFILEPLSLTVALFPSEDLLCGTVYRLNFGSSTVVLHFVDGLSHISFN